MNFFLVILAINACRLIKPKTTLNLNIVLFLFVFFSASLRIVKLFGHNKKKGATTYGCRKWSKSQARRTETALSGNPLWGLQALCCSIPNCCIARCCRSCWSTYLSLEPSAFAPKQSSSPKLLLVPFICEQIASFRHRNCFEIVCKARAV